MKKLVMISAVLALGAPPAFAQTAAQTAAQTNAALSALQAVQGMNGGTAAPTSPLATAAMNSLNGMSGGAKGMPTMDQIKTLAVASMTQAGTTAPGIPALAGGITRQQMADINGKLFDLADSNHDGQLSGQELSVLAKNERKLMSALGH